MKPGYLIFPIIFLCCVAHADVRPLTMCVDNYPPYEIISKNGPATGISVNFVQELAKRLKVPFAVTKQTAFPDCLQKMQSGEVDVLMELLDRDTRKHYIYLFPYFNNTVFTFYVRSDSGLKLEQMNDIRDLKIAVTKGYRYFPEFDEVKDIYQRIETDTLEDAFKKLENKEVDAVVSAVEPALLLMQKNPHWDELFIDNHFYTHVEDAIHLGLSKKSPYAENINAFEEVMRGLVVEGYYYKAINEYYKSDIAQIVTIKPDDYNPKIEEPFVGPLPRFIGPVIPFVGPPGPYIPATTAVVVKAQPFIGSIKPIVEPAQSEVNTDAEEDVFFEDLI